jgi:hypothetical protein
MAAARASRRDVAARRWARRAARTIPVRVAAQRGIRSVIRSPIRSGADSERIRSGFAGGGLRATRPARPHHGSPIDARPAEVAALALGLPSPPRMTRPSFPTQHGGDSSAIRVDGAIDGRSLLGSPDPAAVADHYHRVVTHLVTGVPRASGTERTAPRLHASVNSLRFLRVACACLIFPAIVGSDCMTQVSPRRGYTLAVLLAIYACNFMDRQIFAILKPAIKQELGFSDTQLGLLSGLAFTLFFATLGIPLGLWADRGRRTSLVAAALFLFSGMTAVCSLARGFGSRLLARIGVGVGEAGTSPASHAMIADLYPPEERSRAMAVFALGPHLGLLLGLLLGGLVSHRYGWRVAFLAAGLPGLVLAALTYLTVEEPARLQEPAATPNPQQTDAYNRALDACLSARGYTVR